MRRSLIFALGLAVLLVAGGAVFVALFLDEDKILELASTTLKEQTGATLTVSGDKSLSLFPTLGVSLGDAAITMPGQAEPDITVHTLAIGVQMMPLLSREVVIDTFKLDGLTARVEQAPEEEKLDTGTLSDAELDAYYEQRRREREAAGDAAGAEAALAIPLALNVGQLLVTDARLRLVDTATGEESVIALNRLEASGLNLSGTPIPLELELQLDGDAPVTVELQGDITVDLDNQAANLEGMELKVSGATAEPLTATLEGPVDLARQAAELAIQLSLGETRGSGSLRYASFESPQIDAELSLNLFDPALFALAGPEAAEVAAATKSAEEAPSSGDEPLPLDAIRSIDSKAVLAIEQARFDAHIIEDVKANVRIANGIVAMSGLSGKLHGGQLLVDVLFSGKHNIATLDARGGLNGLDIGAALAATESTAELSGTASLNFELSSRGSTVNELTGSLSGPIKLSTQEVVLEGTSVEHLLCKAVALTNKESLTATFPPRTAFTALSADIQMDKGKAVLHPLTANLADIGLSGRGDFDLLSQDFNATFAARLSPGLEELDRACRVSKRLTAIDWPVSCKGNTAGEPSKWCGVDTEQILKDLAVSEASRKIEKKASKFLNKLFKDKSED